MYYRYYDQGQRSIHLGNFLEHPRKNPHPRLPPHSRLGPSPLSQRDRGRSCKFAISFGRKARERNRKLNGSGH